MRLNGHEGKYFSSPSIWLHLQSMSYRFTQISFSVEEQRLIIGLRRLEPHTHCKIIMILQVYQQFSQQFIIDCKCMAFF